MPAPVATFTIRFAGGPSFGTVLVLGEPLAQLGSAVLGSSAAEPVDFSGNTQRITINRGRTRVLDKFEAGAATVDLIDTTGVFDPDNGTYAGKILPLRQVRISATYGGSERFLFSGFIESWTYRYDRGAALARVSLNCVDGFRLLNLVKISSVAGSSAGDTTGARVGQILDAVSWPSSVRDIDAGLTTVQDDPGTERTALAACQTMSATELGGFWMTGTGDARFLGREEAIKALDTAATEFDDDGSDIGYEGVSLQIDERVLRNKITVTRTGGSAQTVSDATSITEYFERDQTRTGLLMDSDADAAAQARAILAARKDPELRVRELTIDATEDSAARVAAALDLDFFEPLKVTRTQPGGGKVTRTLTVQGIKHVITPSIWKTTFTTAEPIVDGFILGSATRGKLGTSTLAY
ncbi:MAG: hypothetical protein CL489_03025 [Acidobacteria bacterium]|nr:hypothetical protein [Acidobacteriota bacterium]